MLIASAILTPSTWAGPPSAPSEEPPPAAGTQNAGDQQSKAPRSPSEPASATDARKADAEPAAVDLERIFAGGEPASRAELRAMDRHQRALAEKLIACTVGIVVGPAHGSGVIVSADGYVLTAAHVAGEAHRQAAFILPDGRRVRGETCGLYRTLDAGLMRITEPGSWPFATMAEDAETRPGQWCLATGHPGGFEEGRKPVVRLGRILLVDKFAVTTDCTLVGGDSGGPLFDMHGQVIGINSRIGRFLTANMHVPVAAYREVWERLQRGDAWGHFPGTGPYLGVQGDNRSDQAKVARVMPDSPAEKAGLKVGDVIVKFGDQQINDFEDLQQRVNDSQPDEKVTIEIVRDAETITLQLVMEKRRDKP